MAPLIGHPDFESYQSSGYNNAMGWGSRPALLMVDFCSAYWTEGSPLSLLSSPAATAAPDSMRRLVAAARAGKVPVIWTTVKYDDMAESGLFHLKAKMLTVFQESDKRGLNEWPEGLKPQEGDVVIKIYPSTFFGTTLAGRLQLLNVDTLVICRVSTSGCVRASVLDAMRNGIRPVVVGNVCGDRSHEIQNANLFDLNAKYADAVSEDDAVEKLKGGWS